MIFKLNTLKDREAVKQYIGSLPDKPYIVEIKQKKAIRSMPQNRLYWMFINCISKETGNEPEDLHKYFGEKWLTIEEVKMFNKQTILKATSTTKLNTAEFTAYLNKIQIFASTELGIVLPNPEDLIFDSFVDYYADKF